MHVDKILSPEDGVKYVEALLPEVVDVKASDITLSSVGDKTLSLRLGELGNHSLAWKEGQTFKSLTGLDTGMLTLLSEDTRDVCFRELIKKADDFRMKVSSQKIISVAGKGVMYPKYTEVLHRLVNKVKPIGFSNITVRGDKIGFGLMTQQTIEPASRVGDLLHTGIYVSFNGSVKARPYNMRLACTNGMVGSKIEHAFTLEEEGFDSTVDNLLKQAGAFTEEFTHLAEKPLTNSGNMLGRLSRMGMLNPTQVDQVAQNLQELGEEATEYDLINLITAFQHTRENDLSWLEAGGMSVRYLHRDHCSHCGSAEQFNLEL